AGWLGLVVNLAFHAGDRRLPFWHPGYRPGDGDGGAREAASRRRARAPGGRPRPPRPPAGGARRPRRPVVGDLMEQLDLRRPAAGPSGAGRGAGVIVIGAVGLIVSLGFLLVEARHALAPGRSRAGRDRLRRSGPRRRWARGV